MILTRLKYLAIAVTVALPFSVAEMSSAGEMVKPTVEMQAALIWKQSRCSSYAKNGDDAAMKAFAARTRLNLEMHKMHVRHLVAAH